MERVSFSAVNFN